MATINVLWPPHGHDDPEQARREARAREARRFGSASVIRSHLHRDRRNDISKIQILPGTLSENAFAAMGSQIILVLVIIFPHVHMTFSSRKAAEGMLPVKGPGRGGRKKAKKKLLL